ncbi:hypothetical protein ABPG72_005685 [Tetrahymena utriculariae]
MIFLNYKGYQCILDSVNKFTASSISRIYITNSNNQYVDSQFSQGNCNEQILMNPNPVQMWNDILFDFDGSSGQIIAQTQISFDSNFNLQNGNYPQVVGILAYLRNGDSYLNTQVQITQQNSQQKCQNNYYKQSQYQLLIMQPDTSQFTFQTYMHPGSLPNIMSNLQAIVYFKCPIGCSQCTNTAKCSACVANYTLKNNYCYFNCNSTQYAVIIDLNSTEQACQLCDPSCLTCFASSITCTSCSNNFFLNNNSQCQQCDQSCLSCNGDQKSCTVCANSYYPLITGQQQSIYQCFQSCPINYFLNNNQCQKCDQSFSVCTGNSYNCTLCSNGYFPLYSSPTDLTFRCCQICPNGYKLQQNQCQICNQFSSQACQNCAATCRSCQKGQTNNCLDCYQTMNLIGSTCVCKNSQDQRNNFYQCSYNNYAVVQGTFDGSSPTLILEFGSPLAQINNLLCNQVFDQTTLNLFGSNSNCKITSTQIIVTLSNDAVIMVNSTITFNIQAKALQFQGYQNPIDTYYLTQVVQQQAAFPSVNVQYNNIVNSCDDILFQIQSVQNDAKRGFLQFQWNLTPSQNFDDLTLQNINSLIKTANTQQSQLLVIGKYIIPPNTSISINLQYTLKVYQSNTLTFTTFNQKSQQVIIQSIQNKYPPIYRYMELQFFFSFFVQICDQSGAKITQGPLDIKIMSINMPSLSQTNSKFTGQQIEVYINSYSIPQSTILDIQVQAILNSDQSISSSQNISITPQLSKLFVAITSGLDGLVNYKSNYIITGLAIDYEVEDPTSPQGIQLTWSCQNLGQVNGNLQCTDYLNQVYTPPQNVLNVTITAGTFNPYQSLKFTLTGQKDTRTSQQTALLIFAEIDIPPLYIQFDDSAQLQQVNINDSISVTLIYGSNISSDILTYAGAVLYNNNVVGVIKFDYYKVTLRIWDYFSNLNLNNPIVQLRFTVYNPANIMPSLSVTNFNINLPPQKCSLSVSPLNGVALQTKFTIQFTGCSTNNNPLTYQFFYYNQINDQKSEIQKPQNILRRQIQDQSISNQITTILPSGNLLIIGQAMDSFLAVFNSTIQLNVVSYQQNEQLLLNLSLVTLLQMGLCYVGKTLDKKQFKIKNELSKTIFPIPQQINEVQQLFKSNQFQEQQSPSLFPQSPIFQADCQKAENLPQQDLILESQIIPQSKFSCQLDKDTANIINWNTPQNSKSLFFSIKQLKQQGELNDSNPKITNDCKINQNIFESNYKQQKEEIDKENHIIEQNNNQNQENIIQNQPEDQIVNEEDHKSLKNKKIYQKNLSISQFLQYFLHS